MTVDTYNYLAQNGPSTLEELPTDGVSAEDRMNGVHRLNASTTRSLPRIGQLYAIYYIKDKHDPTTVLEEWMDVNSHAVDAWSDQQIHKRIIDADSDFQAASKGLLGPFTEWTGNAGTSNDEADAGNECVFCGETVEYMRWHKEKECPVVGDGSE